MFYSIRWRIGIPFIILILGVMTGLGIYIASFAQQTYIDELENRLFEEASLAADTVRPLLTEKPDPQVIDPLAKHWSTLINARVTIIGSDGSVLGESQEDRLKMENHNNRPEIIQARSSGMGSSIRFSATIGVDMLYVAVPVKQSDQLLGYVRLALPLQRVQANIRHIQKTIGAASLATGLVAVLLTIWIANRTTRPLRELIEAANQMATGKLDTRLIPVTLDEIGNLTRSFNEMSAQLSTQIKTLNAEHERIIAVLNTMNDGVIIVDAENTIQLINPAAQSMFNLKEKEALGQQLVLIIRQYQLEELLTVSRKTAQTQTTLLEIPARQQYLQVTATQLGEALPGNTLLILQNQTRLRRLETIRQDFISNISHELRTPLASLKALTDTLQEGALEDPPAAKRFLGRMQTEVDAITQMVEELLELSRIESGRVPLNLTPVAPIELIEQATERLSAQAERAGVAIEIQCSDELPEVLADSKRLVQVLVNLLHNAIKFTPPGGKITLSARQQDNFVLFLVQDNGAGISADDLPRIFERFYKSDRARTGSGTGLGLAIARHTIEAHGGRIWAESIEGKGSTFYFTVPVATQPDN
jgi:two-component system phosphate regulon sensor histidine kinase PhoR